MMNVDSVMDIVTFYTKIAAVIANDDDIANTAPFS